MSPVPAMYNDMRAQAEYRLSLNLLLHKRLCTAVPLGTLPCSENLGGLVQDLDFSFSTGQNRSPESDQAQKPTYEDIETFLATF